MTTEKPSDDLPWPDPREPRLAVERGYCKLVIQRPDLLGDDWDGLSAGDFTHPAYRAVWEGALAAAGLPNEGEWSHRVRSVLTSATAQQLVVALAVEHFLHDPDRGYVEVYAAKLRLLTVTRAIADLKSKLQRTNPVEHQQAYNRMFVELLDLEANRKELQVRAVGATD